MLYFGLGWKKLGVNFSNAFIDPIELSDDMIAILTKMRRNDTCFIVTPDKSHPSFFQSLRFHLQAICKAVQDYQGILNEVAFVEKANVLKDIIRSSRKSCSLKWNPVKVLPLKREKNSKVFYKCVLQFFIGQPINSGKSRKFY